MYAPKREHEDRHESERRHDVGEAQEKFCLREVVPKKRGRDAFHAKLVDEKQNRHGKNERRTFSPAENPNENLRRNRNQKDRD